VVGGVVDDRWESTLVGLGVLVQRGADGAEIGLAADAVVALAHLAHEGNEDAQEEHHDDDEHEELDHREGWAVARRTFGDGHRARLYSIARVSRYRP
jgi:hypothetical protein